AQRYAGLEQVGREPQQVVGSAVAEHPPEVPVVEGDAVLHVVEDDVHDLAGLLDVAMRRLGLSLGRAQLPLASLALGDVAGRPDHAVGAAVAVAQRDAVLARPAPVAVRRAVAELALEARGLALEMGDQRALMQRAILRMNA